MGKKKTPLSATSSSRGNPSMAFEELPEELITVILSMLPVKSLVRFKCVCKSWYSLIKSPNFINLHLNNSSNHHRCLIIRKLEYDPKHDLHRNVLSFYSYETLIDLGIKINTPFNDNIGLFDIPGVSVSEPCNGLVCITNNDDQIIICNPTTREFRSLFIPPSFGYRCGYHFDSVAFGLDPSSRDQYKVVMIGMHYDNSDHYDPDFEEYYASNSSSPPPRDDRRYRCDRQVVVYDFSTNSWRETGIVFPGSDQKSFNYSQKPITFNGAFHWLPFHRMFGCSTMILSFIMSDEVTGSIPLPEFHSGEMRFTDLFVLNNKSLALIVHGWDGCFEVSEMIEYGEKDSWVRLLRLGPLEGNIRFPLAFWNPNGGGDEKLLLQIEDDQLVDHLVSCDFQHQNLEYFPISGYSLTRGSPSFDVFMYLEA